MMPDEIWREMAEEDKQARKRQRLSSVGSSEFVRLLLRMADDLEISEHLKPYADRARDAARRIETMDKALDAQASTMRTMAHKSCEYEAALDATLECSNGHYNPLFRCGCYERAHNLIMRKQPNESSSTTGGDK